MAKLEFRVPMACNGQTVEEFLKKEYSVSGTTLKKAKRITMGITMDGQHIRTIDKVTGGALITVLIENECSQYTKCDISVPVAYEDSNVIVFNKPPFMPCHPSKGHPYNTVADVFFTNPTTSGLVFRCTGRLDSNTSGLVTVGKHAHACPFLVKNTKKQYLAIIHGKVSGDFVIDAPIERMEEGNPRRCVRKDGKDAVTCCETIASGDKYSVVKLSLLTGRTHQIRTHMSFIGHPLAGDELYGGSRDDIARHALHCFYMEIPNEFGIIQKIKADFPKDLKQLCQNNFDYGCLQRINELFSERGNQ